MIRIKFSEIHYNDDTCKPFLEIGYNDKNLLPNLKIIIQNKKITEYNSYFINFKYGFFDSLNAETLIILDNIFKCINQGYINKNLWNKYVDNNIITIPKAEINYLKSFNHPLKNIDKSMHGTFKAILSFPKDDELERIYNEIDNTNQKHNKLNTIDLNVSNETDLLYIFLFSIFSSEFSYDIVKCQNCNHYFIATKSDTKYCERIFKKDMNCTNFTIYQQYKKKNNGLSPIKTLRKMVYEKEKKKQSERFKTLKHFLKSEENMLKQNCDDDTEQVRFYINYYKGKVRERVIKKLNLSKYL